MTTLITQTLAPVTALAGDNFGNSVASFGDRMAVGSPNASVNAKSGAGSVSMFDVQGRLLTTVTKPSPARDDHFGQSVALSDRYLVVGMDGDDTRASNAGAVAVFDITGRYIRTIANPAPAADDFFGWRVAISGNNLFVSAIGDNITENSGRNDAGSVYQFSIPTGALIRRINDPIPLAGDFFGSDFSVEGSILLVGATGDDTAGRDSGTAFAFNSATGALIATLPNPSPAPNDQFGQSVKLGQGFAAVGAPQDSTAGPYAGIVVIYDTANWVRRQILVDPSPTQAGWFGFSMGFAGNSLFVGAPQDSTAIGRSGSMVEFDIRNWQAIGTTNGLAKNSFFAGTIAPLNNSLLVGAKYDFRGTISSGVAYVCTLIPSQRVAVTTLFGTGVLTNTNRGIPSSMTPTGTVDPHWRIVSSPTSSAALPAFVTLSDSYPFTGPSAAWAANDGNSRWISPQANENSLGGAPNDPVGTYKYETTFDLTGFNTATVEIMGRIYTDNDLASVYINGVKTNITGGGFGGSDFVLSSGFVAGLNTFTVEVVNRAGAHANPSGTRVTLFATGISTR